MKKMILILLLIAAVACAGCKQTTPKLEPEYTDYHKGTDGLVMNFINGLPPDEIIEGSSFVIGVELKNKGAYDIKGCTILLYGFEGGEYLKKENPEIFVDIEGKKPGFPEGGYEIINFNVKNIGIPEIIDVYSAPFTVSANYRYQTEASVDVCINPDVYSYIKTKETVCEPKDIVLKDGQGAPVAVTKIEERTSPSGNKIKVDFVIYFANKGNGEVSGNVYAGDARLSNVPISCKPESVELKGKEEKSIVCTAETLFSSGAYLAPLSVKLVYDYKLMIDKKLNIRSLK